MNLTYITNKIVNSSIHILVKPNSPKNKIIRWDEAKQALRIEIAAAPDKGKANKELIKFLTKQLKKKVDIVSGKTSREKVIRIAD